MPNTEKQEPVEKFSKYGIENCDWCGDWPATYTPLEDASLCGECLTEAVQDYRISQITGTAKL